MLDGLFGHFDCCPYISVGNDKVCKIGGRACTFAKIVRLRRFGVYHVPTDGRVIMFVHIVPFGRFDVEFVVFRKNAPIVGGCNYVVARNMRGRDCPMFD